IFVVRGITIPAARHSALELGANLAAFPPPPPPPPPPATPPEPAAGVAPGFGDAPMFWPIALPLTTNSTRRFNCLPVAVLLEAIGSDSANPRAPTLPDETPWLIRKSRTQSARLSHSL